MTEFQIRYITRNFNKPLEAWEQAYLTLTPNPHYDKLPSVLDQNTLEIRLGDGSAPVAPDLPPTLDASERWAAVARSGRWIGHHWYSAEDLLDEYGVI